MTVMMFGYVNLISIDFYNFISFPNKFCQKYSTVCHFFKSLLRVWKCGQTQSFVFDITRMTLLDIRIAKFKLTWISISIYIKNYKINFCVCEAHIKTDSAQGSSNKCKNYLLKMYSWHGNFFNTV